jgi:hypothetical protein
MELLAMATVNHVEFRAAVGELQDAVDEHPLVPGQNPGLNLYSRHGRQL